MKPAEKTVAKKKSEKTATATLFLEIYWRVFVNDNMGCNYKIHNVNVKQLKNARRYLWDIIQLQGDPLA